MDLQKLRDFNLGMPRLGVTLAPHSPHWINAFSYVTEILRARIPLAIEFHHVGSTAIPGIQAKPILDILGIVDSIEDVDAEKDSFMNLGFTWRGEFGMPGRRYCVLHDAQKELGFVHLHIFTRGSAEIDRHLLFRDYLCAFPNRANEYAELKQKLSKKHALDRDQYTDGKGALISELLGAARAWKQDAHIDERFFKTQDGVQIHCLISEMAGFETPIIFVPGMIGTANMYRNEFTALRPRPCIALTHRGRGKSQSPPPGHYDFQSRCLDVRAVTEGFALEEYFLFGYSRAVPMVVQHALDFPKKVKGLVLVDCDPVYPRVSKKWAEQFLSHNSISQAAIQCIADESVFIDLTPRLTELDCPTLILRGTQQGSLLPEEKAKKMRILLKKAKEVTLPHSGHEIEPEDQPWLHHSLKQFLDSTDLGF